MVPSAATAAIAGTVAAAVLVVMVIAVVVVVFAVVCWLLIVPGQHASASQGRICFDNGTCYHNGIEAADQTSHSILTPGQSVPAMTLYRQALGRLGRCSNNF